MPQDTKYEHSGITDAEKHYYTTAQEAINEGTAWKIIGPDSRNLADTITTGRCLLGKTGAWDAYGNYIPSRDEVTPGARGSLEYATRRCGADWANYIKEV